MRVGVLADVHGNLPALEAVLGELEREAPDRVVVCGDVVSGPLPAETLDCLMALPAALFVRGNADRGVVAAYDHAPPPRWPGPYAEWCAARITRRHRDFLASFEPTVRLEVDGLGRVLFCHGSPRSDEEIMSARTPLARMRDLVADVDADVVVCGHTHMQLDRRVDRLRVANPGSVGMPYEAPEAQWALLGPDLAFRRTDYRRDEAATLIRSRVGDEMDDFVRENVLASPSADEAFALFAAHGGP